MSSRLVNVRLDEERLRKARVLREQGLALSDVIREAIDERFERVNRSRNTRDLRNIIQRIFEQYPDPPSLPPRAYDVHHRKAARDAILEGLRRRRTL
jgi:Arc/MetJ-type ribon-helix-helix transcriptional regulator